MKQLVRKPLLRTVKSMFKAKELEVIQLEEGRLDKERRLENKRRLERGWKEKRQHYQLRSLALEWILEFPVAGAEQEAAGKVEQTVKLFMEDLLQIVMSVQEKKSSARLERKNIADVKRDKCLDGLGRNEKAEAQREALMKKLEAGWAAMEKETFQIEHTIIPEGRKGKRKRKP